MDNNESDTICAISTPLGMGGIGMVRLSGPDAVGIASNIFSHNSKKVGDEYQSHTIIYGNVVNPVDGAVVDEALMTVMLAPRTYTREDVVEINCHGGPAAVRKVLELAVSAGARLAQPGEFTRRAYINGRIDLTQAEAVMDLIASKGELSLQAAVNQLRGGLSEKVGALRESLTEALSLTEVSIDFPEEEIDYVPISELRGRGREVMDGIKSLLDTYDEGRVLRDGLRVAIVGRPNVGKSSLLNLLARAERAIVTEVPGTTRDTVEEFITLGGVPVKVIDTAGIRHSRDVIEMEGIRRSEEALRQSDLALLVLDGSRELTDEDRAMIEKVRDYKHIVVINKSDLPQKIAWTAVPSQAADLERKYNRLPMSLVANNPPAGEGTAAHVRISAKYGDGLEELTARIKDAALGGGRERPPEAFINLRHKEALKRAGAALERFDAGCGEGLSAEFLALELREALDAVGGIVGVTTPEDVLNRIFDNFCIGK